MKELENKLNELNERLKQLNEEIEMYVNEQQCIDTLDPDTCDEYYKIEVAISDRRNERKDIQGKIYTIEDAMDILEGIN